MKTKYISCLVTALLSAGVFSCSREDAGEGNRAFQGPVDVQVVVNNVDATRSVGSDATDNEIRRLRVYAFNVESGELSGYALADNLSEQTYVPMTLSQGGDTYFYVLANDHFGQKPTLLQAGGQEVTDWAGLDQSDLKNLVFDLSDFTGWTVNNGECISPMSNNRYKENGQEELEYENDYATPVEVTGNNQIIPVTVQHVLGRLRLLLNKTVSGNVSQDIYVVKLTRAAVYHRPDAFRLYNIGTDAISYDNNVEALVDEFVTDPIELQILNGTTYTEVARTFLAPNIYGSDDTVGTAPAQNADKAYRLELTVSFAFQGGGAVEKNYTVYLPPVSRNESIDVQGTFDASAVELQFNVMTNAWVEKNITIPDFQ